MPAGASPSERDIAVGPGDLVRMLWSGKWWIIASCVFGACALAAVAYAMTPTYRAATLLVASAPDRGVGSGLSSAFSSLGGLASLAGLNVGQDASAADEALAVLRSRQFTEKFIGDKNLLPKLFSERWDQVAGRWTAPPDRRPTLGQGFRYFDTYVRTVLRDKRTGLVTLQIDWKDRVDAADWANDLVHRLNAEMRGRAIAKADASLGYLRHELEATTFLESKEAINRLVEGQINRRMIASVTEEFAFGVVDRAVPPDQGDTVRPNKPAMIVIGLLLGLSLGVGGVCFVRVLSLRRRT